MTDRNRRLGLLGDGSAWISAVAGSLFTALSLAIEGQLRTESEPTDLEESAIVEVRHG